MSGLVAALAGVLIAARLGAVRGEHGGKGFELDIITVVLLGGVSIFGGSGTMFGVLLSTYLVLNIRNGLAHRGHHGQHADRRHRPAADPVGARCPNLVGRRCAAGAAARRVTERAGACTGRGRRRTRVARPPSHRRG